MDDNGECQPPEADVSICQPQPADNPEPRFFECLRTHRFDGRTRQTMTKSMIRAPTGVARAVPILIVAPTEIAGRISALAQS